MVAAVCDRRAWALLLHRACFTPRIFALCAAGYSGSLCRLYFMPGRLQQHARERLNFSGEVSTAKRLAACKTFLRLESAMIRMRHEAGDPGLKVAQARAAMIDALLAHLFDYAIDAYGRAHGQLPSPVALIALGGYGRSELSPLSDVDIMFLFSAKTKPAAMKPLQAHLTNEILYIL